MAGGVTTSTFRFQFTQGPLVASPGIIEDDDVINTLNLLLIVSPTNPVQPAAILNIYTVQIPIDSEGTFAWTEAEYIAALSAATPKGLALRTALGGNTGCAFLGCDELIGPDAEFNTFSMADPNALLYVGGKAVVTDDEINVWADDLIDNVWNG